MTEEENEDLPAKSNKAVTPISDASNRSVRLATQRESKHACFYVHFAGLQREILFSISMFALLVFFLVGERERKKFIKEFWRKECTKSCKLIDLKLRRSDAVILSHQPVISSAVALQSKFGELW